VAALLLAQTTNVPSSGNVLATPQPAVTFAPDFAVHPPPDALRLGQQLYSVHCSSCHGAHMEGSAQGPPLVNVDAGDVDFELSTGRMPAEHPFEQEYERPPFFRDWQIRALVAYVMTRSGGDKRLPVARLPGNVERGRRVFEENCQQCHAATGHGDNVGYRNVAPELMNASPTQIAEAVRMGPDVMPRFGPKIIDDAALGDIIAYVNYLQHAKYNPGGLQLANFGPVPEGFIAWVVGIGLLVLFVRRIGSTD
jgi:ubiquinol-cytochrome c reductase cytochrome c subunit